MYIYTSIHMYVYIDIYIYIYVHAYIHIFRKMETRKRGVQSEGGAVDGGSMINETIYNIM